MMRDTPNPIQPFDRLSDAAIERIATLAVRGALILAALAAIPFVQALVTS